MASPFTHHIPSRVATLLLALSIAAFGSAPGSTQPAGPETQIAFDIPAQSLSRALMAYGAATGRDIFYNAALADKRISTAVVGVFTPDAALQSLLQGTGYAAKDTGPGTFTIVGLPRAEVPAAVAAGRKRLEPYFAAIQTRVSDELCRKPAASLAAHELLLQLWLAPSGAVTRAAVVGYEGDPVADQSAASILRGLRLGAPPAGIPQPINLVIFPRPASSRACMSASAGRGAG